MHAFFLDAGINYSAGLIGWLIIGAVAGWLAGKMMSGHGFGILADTIIGMVGAVVGGLILSLFNIGANGLLATLVTAFIGACIFIAVLRSFSRTNRAL